MRLRRKGRMHHSGSAFSVSVAKMLLIGKRITRKKRLEYFEFAFDRNSNVKLAKIGS